MTLWLLNHKLSTCLRIIQCGGTRAWTNDLELLRKFLYHWFGFCFFLTLKLLWEIWYRDQGTCFECDQTSWFPDTTYTLWILPNMIPNYKIRSKSWSPVGVPSPPQNKAQKTSNCGNYSHMMYILYDHILIRLSFKLRRFLKIEWMPSICEYWSLVPLLHISVCMSRWPLQSEPY